MSNEELNSLKDEIYLSIRQLEQKIFDAINIKIAQISDNYQKYNEKLDFIVSNNRNMIESVVSEKINTEKLNALESFRNKADGILISHEIRINNQNKEINNMKAKYDKVIEDNLLVPGLIGSKCQFNNVKEYINANNSDIARLKFEKNQLKAESKDFKSRYENLFKQMITVVNNSVERSKDFTKEKIAETKKQFDTKIDEFNERSKEIRIDIQQIKTDIETQVNDFKKETEKLNNFSEKNRQLEGSIVKINNSLMKVNYEINKIYDKNNNLSKKYADIKGDVDKLKIMSDIRNKSRNLSNNIKFKEKMESNTIDNIGKLKDFNEFYKDNNYTEKKAINDKRKKYFEIQQKKLGFNNLTKDEIKIGKNKSPNKRILNPEKKSKLNKAFQKHLLNNNINNENEEKTETIISEESLNNINNKEQNDIKNINDFAKTLNNNRIILRNENIIHTNPTYKENIYDNKYNIENNIINTTKESDLIRRRVSEIKFDLKTGSLKKTTYDIANENMFFPKINRQSHSNSIDNNINFIIQNNQKNKDLYRNTNNNDTYNNDIDNNDNSVNSESIHKSVNININNNNEIKEEINNENNINNESKIKKRKTSNSQKDIICLGFSNNSSKIGSVKSGNEISEKENNIRSYRTNQKNKFNDNNILYNDNIIKKRKEKSPKYFEEGKYLLSNIKKGRKKFNLSQSNDKNINTNISNKNYIHYINYSPRHFHAGINIVGLNDEYYNRKNSIDDNIYFDNERENNLKLERIGIPSTNSQKPKKKKIKLQGISTEIPLKISAAFGRTAYTFINKDNSNKVYSLQMTKKKPETEKLDVYLGNSNVNK